MDYEQPLGHVACEEVGDEAPASEKAAAAALSRQAGYQGLVLPADRSFNSGLSAAFWRINALDHFDQLVAPSLPGAASHPTTCLFLHHRRGHGSHDRLIRVDLAKERSDRDSEWLSIEAMVFKPAGLFSTPHLLSSGRGLTVGAWHYAWMNPNSYRFLSGRIDPADQSHFTIDYDVSQPKYVEASPRLTWVTTRGRIDGWLRDDDTVLLNSDRRPFELWSRRSVY